MPRRKKMENISLEEQLVTVEQEIKTTEAELKELRLKAKDLRKKIEAAPGSPQYIHTVRGVGYKLVTPEE